ncbi:autotransporter outer membrane beta-barrel domain-containing protein [Aestuariibius insulae]|uniref:autotransporter outer membrane beta-barrel domain-containing protein n=1 Tax=Aestuariibius insulae TaxID=2058287 RepID=UPI00398E5B2A
MRAPFFATVISVIPSVSTAQDFIWDITPRDRAVVGGSGVLDQGETPNFQSPDGQSGQVFPGGEGIAFTARGEDENVVTVQNEVSVAGLRFEVDGYQLTGDGQASLELGEGPADLILNNGSGVAIDVSLSGEMNVVGDGTLSLSGDQFELGSLVVGNDATLLSSANGNTDVTNFGETSNQGTIGNLTNFGVFTNTPEGLIAGEAFNDGGQMDLAGTIGGSLVNGSNGTIEVTSDLFIREDFLNGSGSALISGGETEVFGSVVNGDIFGIAAGAELIASSTTNEIGGRLFIDGVLQSETALQAGSTTELSGAIVGNVTNDGLLIAGPRAEIEGSLANAGSVTLASGRAGDSLAISGDLTGNGSYTLDLDLSGAGNGDRIVVEGETVGEVNLTFNIVAQPDTAGQQRILVFDIDETAENDFTFSSSGLPASNGTSVYSLVEEGDLFVLGQVSPGVTSIAANLVLTQSLIGAIVNRPTSPFVVGLGYEDPDPCGAGVWTRFQGGQADASPDGSNGVSQVQSTVSADYTGYQAGGDFACFRNPEGWDLAFGVIGGINDGTIEQPVFGIDPMDPERMSTTLTSNTTTDFSQSYLGIYGTATSGRLSADLQVRAEHTEFDITNEGVDGLDGIGIDKVRLTSDATTVSGAVSYAFPVGETAFAIIPTAGMAITRGTSGSIDFDDGSRLDIGDFKSEVGFAGVTGSWSRVDEDGQGALSTFVTSTYYNDFSDPVVSRFTSSTGERTRIENDTLGSYGELSAGLSYLRLAAPDNAAGVKQYAGSVRADARFGDQIDSWGLTAQMRIQF